MNVRQKIGLGIVTPLFVLAVGHTIVNKINTNKDEKIEQNALPNITDALNIQSKEAATVFKAEQEILNKIKEGNSTIEDIPINELELNYVECGN